MTPPDTMISDERVEEVRSSTESSSAAPASNSAAIVVGVPKKNEFRAEAELPATRFLAGLAFP